MKGRYQSLEAFWPYYLSRHRSAASRCLHFVGTTGAMTAALASTALNPLSFPAAVAGMLTLGKRAITAEAEKRSFRRAAALFALPTAAAPVVFPAGVLFATGCAWTGQLLFDRRVPTSFEYPVMSLASDLRMWSHMLRGRLWRGDPLEELGLAPPPAHKADHLASK